MHCPTCQGRLRCNETRVLLDGSIMRRRTCEDCKEIVGTIERVDASLFAGKGKGNNPASQKGLQAMWEQMRKFKQQRKESKEKTTIA